MAEGEGCIELKFRIYDGTDIAHSTYSSSTTVGTLKQKLVAEWPQGKTVTPKSVSDLKLIHAGKVLENNKTLADYRITFGEIPGGVVTMHVVVQPPVTKKKQLHTYGLDHGITYIEKNKDDKQKMNSCSCTIL
ncbi:Membrane-anchored ubiquitin-fold protein 3 isoform E [Glycine soja]|uniref:Membrane-anchored ubiquitin-fold protein n=1 Tax=Glycine soja TaxID=3848 RepID=A0A445FJG2_GLYSO|nr:Membrane-anchored ubiquitin-fold protein 3 isoform E [Glycine soja]